MMAYQAESSRPAVCWHSDILILAMALLVDLSDDKS